MYSMQRAVYNNEPQPEDNFFHYFTLQETLAENQVLVLNTQIRMLSLLAEGPFLLEQQPLTDSEVRIIKPLLEAFPWYCPYETLLASMFATTATPALVTRWQKNLNRAREEGTWQQELKPLRRTLSSLRRKLHTFSLEICTVRELGCNLSRAKTQETLQRS